MTELAKCRWCGTGLNEGYSHCTVCSKPQSRFHNIFGEGGNLIALLAALITFAQLMVAIGQNNSAVEAADLAEQAQISTEQAVTKFEKLETRFKQIELDTRNAVSEIKQTSLKLQAIESESNREEIERAQNELSKARNEYDQLAEKLANTSPTTVVPKVVTKTRKECINLGFTKTCTNVPDVRTVQETVANPEYKAIQLELEVKLTELQAKEKALAEVIHQ